MPEYPRPPWTQFGGSKALEGTEYVPPTEEDGDESPLAVARWVLQQAVFNPETGTRRYGKENVFITGDSAGGNLSLATLLSAAGRGGPGGFEHPYYPALKDEIGELIAPNIAGLALQSPWVDLRTGPPTGPPRTSTCHRCAPAQERGRGRPSHSTTARAFHHRRTTPTVRWG